MRGTTGWLLAIALALALTGAAYLGLWLRSDVSAADTFTAEPCHWENTVALTAVVVREEQLLSAPGGVRLLCPDGQRVAANTALGVTGESAEDYFRGWLLLRLKAELTDSERTGAASGAALKKEASSLRRALGRGDFDGAALSAAALENRLFPRARGTETLRSEIEALTAAGAETQILYAPASGYFLRATDGWEALSAVKDEDWSAQMLRTVLARGAEPTAAAGRLVTGSAWRLAALTGGDAPFAPGDAVTLEINGERFAAEVARLFPGGVLFTGRTGLDKLLRSRYVTARAVLFSAEGLMLPAAAVHYDDDETYVYRLAGGFARKTPVTVLARREGEVLVASDTLRAGGEVLLSGEWADGARVR